MWCHLCKLNFTNYETFKCHVMDKHKSTEDFYEANSDDDKSENSLEIPDDFDLDSDLDDDNENKEKVDESNPQESLNSPVPTPTEPQTRYTLRKRKSTSVELSSSCSEEGRNLSPIIMNSDSINDDKSNICSVVLDQNKKNQSGPQITYSYVIPPSFLAPDDIKKTTEETLKWLKRHQLFCENMKYPLSASLFAKLQKVQENICNQYCTCESKNELTEAVLKIYEDLTSRIQQHIKSLNDAIP